MERIANDPTGFHLFAEPLDVPVPSGPEGRMAAFDRVLTVAGALLANL